MRIRPRWIPLAATLVLLGGAPHVAGATCQIPLAIGQAGAQANVLILLDNSLSMNEALVSADYDPSVRWAGKFSSSQTYNITSSGNYTPAQFSRSFPVTPSAYLVASDAGEAGQYSGNYLNWVYFNATAAQRAAIPVVTRIQQAKAVVNTVLASVTGCQFGIEVFNGSNGGTILAPFGTSVGSMQSSVTAVRANAYTPLAESMVSAINYLSTTGSGAPIVSSCQKSFIIIVTDGLPTQDTTMPSYIRDANGDGFFLDDVATHLYRNDLRPDLDGLQNAAVFTIGFNVDATATGLLQETADNGGGLSFSISDGAGLMAALTADLNTITARVAAGSSVSVVASENRSHNRLYRARYESQTWKGFLEAFDLPYHAGNPAVWEAGSQLAATNPDARTVFTSTNGRTLTGFTVANAAALASPLAVADAAAASNLIRFVRGTAVAGMRDRGGWPLGDIVDAAPVAVGPPNSWNEFHGYSAFRAAHAGRTEVVYAAANDGMLHCFDAGTGAEQWAYVPNNQLPRLQRLADPAYCHDYFLNMTPAAYDVWLGTAWRTLLIGGDAQGGSGLFALDVTDPSADSLTLAWDVDLPALKGSWNSPTLVRDRTRDAQVLCVGTGYDPATSQASLLVLDPASGSVSSSFTLGSPASGNKTTRAVPIDRDSDGYDDLLYVGDLAGNLWRVDLTTSPWSVSLLFSGTQPIQAPPVVTLDDLGRPMLFFGTGQYLAATDPGNTSTQTIYGIVDDGSLTTLTPASLVNQTTTITALTAGRRGWYVNLVQQPGERVIRGAALLAGTLYVTTFQPGADACSAGGQSWLYAMDYRDGSAPSHPLGLHTTDGRVNSMGDGILADPSVDLPNEQIILQSSNAVLLTQDIAGGLKRLLVRSWRQKWN